MRVEQLFGKVPVRRKFLRSARSEYAACADIVRRLAMARPDIGFTLEHDGRRNIAVQPGESRELRVAALTDRELADNHVMVALQRVAVPVRGVAALPTYHRGGAAHHFLFVHCCPAMNS